MMRIVKTGHSVTDIRGYHSMSSAKIVIYIPLGSLVVRYTGYEPVKLDNIVTDFMCDLFSVVRCRLRWCC